MNIHILGAPGSGVTTLGKTIATALNLPHFDTDDYHWFTDDALPYRRRRNPDHRRQLMAKDLDGSTGWVLTGSLCGWGDVFIPQFDRVIYLWLPVEIRLARIRERECARYGADRIATGGDLHLVFEKFMAWAAGYDDATGNIRSYDSEQAWIQALSCPVLRLEAEMPLEEMVGIAVSWLR